VSLSCDVMSLSCYCVHCDIIVLNCHVPNACRVVDLGQILYEVKVKVTLVQALRLCTGRTAHRGSRGKALLCHDMALEGGEGSASRPGHSLPPGKDPVPIVQEAGWAPGPIWTSAENLASPPGFDPRTVQPVASRYTD